MKTMLTRFQGCLSKIFLGNDESTTMADYEVEEEEPQAGHGKGRKRRKGIGRTRRERESYSLNGMTVCEMRTV